MKTRRGQSREVPPEIQSLCSQGISSVFTTIRCVDHRDSDLVLPYQMNVTVTDSALEQMSTICDTNGYAAVRYSLNGGGCSGLIGKWQPELHYEPESGDITWKLGEDKVFVIDHFTIEYMYGATVDYGGDFMPAFKVGIPDRKSCGCGESFVLE